MSNRCTSCQQALTKDSTNKICPACREKFCVNCVYQRVAVPQLNYQMHEVCLKCYQRITTELLLHKPPKNFITRLEQQPKPMQRKVPSEALDPETQALDERLQKLRMNFPGTKAPAAAAAAAVPDTPDDLLQQMNDAIAIEQNADNVLAERLRILHATMPAATPNTVVLPSSKPVEEEKDDEDEEFPWCTVCNENATKRCLDCDELFCEACARKIHRQSDYKRHQLESYKPSAKAKKKHGY